ncbi:hypothetical protein M426DRAFT_268645 [Hypoxylon sp. CI-4A]|nr:hypothetical protein M426DRAFT_268645 [Hypoxylon sp. CI-4A]
MKFLAFGLVAVLASIVNASPIDSVANSGPPETARPPHWPHPTSSSVSTSTSSSTSFIITVTTLPPQVPTSSASAACPTVTHTTRPSDCEPFLCPVPGCTVEQELFVPCGCSGVKTALYVDGCQTVCPEGCITRVRTATALCATPTAALF